MFLDRFNYDLPKSLIADRPVNPRHNSRLLKLKKNTIQESLVKDIPQYLNDNDLIIFNDSKVIKARVIGLSNNRKFELLFTNSISSYIWSALIKPFKKINKGDVINFADDFSVSVLSKNNNGLVSVELNNKEENFLNLFEKYGSVPIPPYIQKIRNADDKDIDDYQSIFAKNIGSVAAPTASLHFTDSLIAKLKNKGIEISTVTLHIGLGTFLPIKVKNLNDHVMHEEYGEVSEEVIEKIYKTKSRNGRIITIGTSSMRILESAFSNNIKKEFKGNTSLFIKPGFQFKIVDMLITNFHLPKSTLLMLVCAFAGKENIFKAYQYAIENKYRFFSYGDAMLLYRL